MYFLRSSSISGFIDGNLLSERLYHHNSCRGTLSTRFGHGFLVKFFEGNALVVIVEFKEFHFVPTVRALQGVIPKRRKNSSTPLIETTKNMMFFFCYSPMQKFVNFTVARIDSAISDHFKVLFRDMSD